MQQSCMYGSVRGALGNRRPYRDNIRFGDNFHIQSALRSIQNGFDEEFREGLRRRRFRR